MWFCILQELDRQINTSLTTNKLLFWSTVFWSTSPTLTCYLCKGFFLIIYTYQSAIYILLGYVFELQCHPRYEPLFYTKYRDAPYKITIA